MSAEPAGPFGTFHHVGIVVPDLEGPAEAICALLAGRVGQRGEDEELGARWLWVEAPGTPVIELIAPTSEQGPIAGFLARRGSGLHHLSYLSEGVDAARGHALTCGLDVIGEAADHDGFEELFIHPRATGGALFHTFREIAGDRLTTSNDTGAAA